MCAEKGDAGQESGHPGRYWTPFSALPNPTRSGRLGGQDKRALLLCKLWFPGVNTEGGWEGSRCPWKVSSRAHSKAGQWEPWKVKEQEPMRGKRAEWQEGRRTGMETGALGKVSPQVGGHLGQGYMWGSRAK